MSVCLLLKQTHSHAVNTEQSTKDGQEIFRLRGDILPASVDAEALISRLLDMSMRAAIPDASDGMITRFAVRTGLILRADSLQPNEQDAVIDVMKQMMNIIVGCSLSSPALREKLIAHPSLDLWLVTLLLQCPQAARRLPVASAIYTISANTDG